MNQHSPITLSTQFGFINRDTHYLDARLNPSLISNEASESMLSAIRRELLACKTFTFSVAFISTSALAMLKEALLEFNGTGTIITSTYLGFNEPAVFEELLTLPGVETLVYDDQQAGFHVKGYVFEDEDLVTAIVGSSNLTSRALVENREWNLKFSAAPDGQIVSDIRRALQLQKERSVTLTSQWVKSYEALRQTTNIVTLPNADNTILSGGKVIPNSMQSEALESISKLRARGETKAVVISATGTGKTILAALAAREAAPKKILFIAHREQILQKSIEEFRRVLAMPRNQFGRMAGGIDQSERPFLFATVQSLSKRGKLDKFAKTEFDFIIIDEVHRASARTYRDILNYFEADFTLGLTATPERTDGVNIFELFDYNVPYEIRLETALEANMLVPFHYYGVTDYITPDNQTIEDTSKIGTLLAPERVKHLRRMLERYGHTRGVRGLIFCSSVAEATNLSKLLNQEVVHGKKLVTRPLLGSSSMSEREEAIASLNSGMLDYILTVDIFNEGIDIPAVNQVVFLRQTESAIVFTQQLGRGLRKAPGKDHLRVIDFIGNYTNNFMIPIALFGENSRNKDRIRKRILEAASDNAIAGQSTVNFDEISQRRVLESISKVRLTSVTELKKEIQLLKDRLNRVPKLFDFLAQGTTDPVLMATEKKNYWALLHQTRFAVKAPTAQQGYYLNFFSKELLPGLRPHELLILKHLLEHHSVTKHRLRHLLEQYSLDSTDTVLASVKRVLLYDFYVTQQRVTFGDLPVAEMRGESFVLHPQLLLEYNSDALFRTHVDDILDTGLYLARHVEGWSSTMKIGNKYTRRESTRLLGFEKNGESVVFGYRVDWFSRTCPIYVTYEKSESTDPSLQYGNRFLDRQTLHWYTRKNLTTNNDEVKQILSGKYPLHVFIKKDDAEGSAFYYLGTADPENPQDAFMPHSPDIPVVTMDLKLHTPVSPELFAYLTQPASLHCYT